MKKILKKMTALAIAIVMIFALTPSVNAREAYTVEDAYDECAAMYPEFVNAIIENGATRDNIIRFLYGLQEYLLNLNVELNERNIDSYMLEGINDLMNKRVHTKLRDAIIAAFPGAVLDGAEGKIAPEFQPLVETVKNIIFENDMLGGGESSEPDTTEPETESKTEPTEKPTEPETAPTEKETEKKPGGNSGNGASGNGSANWDDDDTTEPTEKPTEPKVTFSDMKDAQWAQKAVDTLVAMDVINGYPDGTFKPNNLITRAEFSKIIVLTSGRYKPSTETYASAFSDVAQTAWEYPFVSAAYGFGFIKGRSETIFDPNSNITRADLCLIVYRYIMSINSEFKVKTNVDGTPVTFSDMANVPEYAKEAVNALYSNNIASLRDTANNKFEPNLPATRAECAYIVYNAINAALGLNN